MSDFHKGESGGNLFWNTMANKILREGYYWPTLFADVYKTVTSSHECQIFQGRRKLQPLPLKPVEVNASFQQWGLDIIREILPTYSVQHKWILTVTDYFTKWIEEIPTWQATESVIIQFLETNILSCFGCPNKLIANNVAAFKSKKMIDFCSKYKITLGCSIAYYLQVLVVKLLQEAGSEEDHFQLRISQMIHLQHTREEVFHNTFRLQERIKNIYDRKAKADKFQIEDIVLRCDARNEDKGKHDKFENLWKGPYRIVSYRGQNDFILKEMNGEDCPGGPVNGRLLK
eukprot:PITA_31446